MRTTSVVHAVDTHACGEPARVIVGGVADVPGQTLFEKMKGREMAPPQETIVQRKRALMPRVDHEDGSVAEW